MGPFFRGLEQKQIFLDPRISILGTSPIGPKKCSSTSTSYVATLCIICLGFFQLLFSREGNMFLVPVTSHLL